VGALNFLKQAESLKPAVSPQPKRRHNEWLEKIFIKERVKMFATILVIISLLLGGSGGAVFASQASLPNDLLYPVKTWSEQVQAQFADGPEQQYQLMLRFADQRVAELEKMAEAGKTPPDATVERLRLHLDECLQLAAQQDDPDMLRLITQLQTRLKLQDHKLAQAQEKAGPAADAALTKARTLLQIRLRLTETALEDPQQFRSQVRAGISDSLEEPQQNQEMNQEKFQQGEDPWTEEAPPSGSQSGFGEKNGGNPWTDTTPTPGSGYGSGEQKGDNPWTDTTPTPGSGYGPGDSTGCTNPDGCPKSGSDDSSGGSSGGSSAVLPVVALQEVQARSKCKIDNLTR
jgi:hypothetical protein